MTETIFSAIIAYAATNIDDLFIGMVLYLDADSRKRRFAVSLGKFLGIGVLVLTSLIAAYGFGLFFRDYIWLLGLIPIALGIREALTYNTDGYKHRSNISAIGAAAITISNGADNIGVYIPLFSGCSVADIISTIIIFAIMTAIWCLLSSRLSASPGIHTFLQKHRRIIVPTVFVALGIYIIFKGIL